MTGEKINKSKSKLFIESVTLIFQSTKNKIEFYN